ncbi:MAG: S1 RNA-binding domain-containing protein [Lachnospiraceae bacterium]|nr:S1 RNA-binding domain-containing protein [Lachnospiraceae bacterium]
MNRLKAVSKTEHGMYLAESDPAEEKVLLPKKYTDGQMNVGDMTEVFLYKDSSDRLIATTVKPKIMLHEVALLRVKDVGKIGAFVDWGLEKDLLLPFREQTKTVHAGEEVLVALYVDKTGRLALTMNVYEYLRTDSPYQKDDTVNARVYLISRNFGAFVAVDDQYSALIPKKELFVDLTVGETVTCRVAKKEEDGKLTLSIRQKSYEQMDDDAEAIVQKIRGYGGKLPFNDKAAPEVIKREFSMSKAQFKRAVGRLYKERRIEITDASIILKES